MQTASSICSSSGSLACKANPEKRGAVFHPELHRNNRLEDRPDEPANAVVSVIVILDYAKLQSSLGKFGICVRGFGFFGLFEFQRANAVPAS